MDGEVIQVRFGHAPDDVLPLAWAEKILSILLREDPSRFAKLLGKCVLEGRPDSQDTPARGRNYGDPGHGEHDE